MPAQCKHEINIRYLLMVLQSWWNVWSQVGTIPEREFKSQLAAGHIPNAAITEITISDSFKTASEDRRTQLLTARTELATAKDLAAEGITSSGGTDNTFLSKNDAIASAAEVIRVTSIQPACIRTLMVEKHRRPGRHRLGVGQAGIDRRGIRDRGRDRVRRQLRVAMSCP